MSGERRKNPADMTVTEQIEAIAEEFCMNYCKWPDQWDEEEEGCELSESKHCQNCPISRL